MFSSVDGRRRAGCQHESGGEWLHFDWYVSIECSWMSVLSSQASDWSEWRDLRPELKGYQNLLWVCTEARTVGGE
jgi:hypothetical protein